MEQDRQPLPPSDMILTFADITTSKAVLGFSPKTPTNEGVRDKFCAFGDMLPSTVQESTTLLSGSGNTMTIVFSGRKEVETPPEMLYSSE